MDTEPNWTDPASVAQHLLVLSGDAISADLARFAGQPANGDGAREKLVLTGKRLESAHPIGVHVVGIFARRMGETIVTDLTSGDQGFANLLNANVLTPDSTANYFVKLFLQVVRAEASGDAVERREAKDTFTGSLQNLEKEPKFAADAALALAHAIVARLSATALRPSLGLSSNMTDAEVSIFIAGLRDL